MEDKEILALMYDFYNSHLLSGQNEDINYYINQLNKYNSKNVLVVGAGTGRVAIPISQYAKVTALDFDETRLKILKSKKSNIPLICENFLNFDNASEYDLIILPYSTIQFDNNNQKLDLMLKKIKQISNENTITIFDMSESFNFKSDEHNLFLFKDYCDLLSEDIEVFYSSNKMIDYIEFYIEYKLLSSRKSVIENERYYYYNKELLLELLRINSLDILKLDNGYGKDNFNHKHLYHVKRRIYEK